MGSTLSNLYQQEDEQMTNNDSDANIVKQLPIVKYPTAQQLAESPTIWNPAFNEFKLGDSVESINACLPKPFSTLTWDNLPQADEYKHDIVKYFWLKLSEFNDQITKFIPPNMSVNETSYVCFLFFNEKLFHISVRLFHDGKHPNYDEIVEAYAKAVNTSIIKTERGKEFYYEDTKIIFISCLHSDKSHQFIEVIQKDQTKSTDGYGLDRLTSHHRLRKSSFQLLMSPQPSKYDIMISYCHKDKELCHHIYYRLLEDKFRVWIDLENMYGPIVERMAEAIENSEFVLICMSDAYKLSSYCKLEAEYAFKFQACLIPLVVKKDFTSTGWLGMLCGLRTHIDFTKTTFDVAYEKLVKEIEHYRTQSTKQIQSSTNEE